MSKNLHIINSLDPKYGGPVSCARELSRGLISLGHEADIVCGDLPDEPFLASLSPKSKVYALGPSYFKYYFNPRMSSCLREIASNYDAAIIHGMWQYHGIAASLAFSKARLPYYVFSDGMLDPYFKRKYPLKHLKKSIYWQLFEKKVFKNARGILFTSGKEKELAEETFPIPNANKIVVDYGTSAPPDEPEKQIQAWHQLAPHLQGKRYFLFLGRIHEKKGIDLTIRAFAEKFHANSEEHLVIAGPADHAYGEKLKEMTHRLPMNVGSRIHWVGMLRGDEKWGAIRSSEAFVLHSHQENFGIAVAEALACGVPVLISDRVNIYDEIEKSGAGIVGADTLQGARETLEKWSSLDSEAKRQYQIRARQFFENKYDFSKNVRSIADILFAPNEVE